MPKPEVMRVLSVRISPELMRALKARAHSRRERFPTYVRRLLCVDLAGYESGHLAGRLGMCKFCLAPLERRAAYGSQVLPPVSDVDGWRKLMEKLSGGPPPLGSTDE